MKVVFEDEHIKVVYFYQPSDDVVITFGHMNSGVRQANFFGHAICVKTITAALGFMPKRPNWYPSHSVEEAVKVGEKYLSAHKRRICYGGSMGAYGALKYSQKLRADLVLAFSPQCSINPDYVSSFERRFSSYFDDEIHQKMEIEGDDIGGSAFLFYDNYFCADRKHAEIIASKSSNVSLVKVPMTSHTTIEVFAGTENWKNLLKICANDDKATLASFVYERRRKHRLRIRSLAESCAKSHPVWAEKIYEYHMAQFKRADQIICCDALCRGFLSKGERQSTSKWAEELMLLHSTVEAVDRRRYLATLNGLAWFCAKLNMMDIGERLSHLACLMAPGDVRLGLRYAEILGIQGRKTEAYDIVKRLSTGTTNKDGDIIRALQRWAPPASAQHVG